MLQVMKGTRDLRGETEMLDHTTRACVRACVRACLVGGVGYSIHSYCTQTHLRTYTEDAPSSRVRLRTATATPAWAQVAIHCGSNALMRAESWFISS